MDLRRFERQASGTPDVAPLAGRGLGDVALAARRGPIELEVRCVVDRLTLGRVVDTGDEEHGVDVIPHSKTEAGRRTLATANRSPRIVTRKR
jgi:hypothetical protein